MANHPNAITRAEQRIYRNVKLMDGRKVTSGNTVQGTATITAPTGFLHPRFMKVTVSSVDQGLLFKDPSFIREAWPTAATQGTPRWYSITNATTLTIAPTPDAVYAYTLGWYGNGATIVDASDNTNTSWLGDNAENALLWGSIFEQYLFMKGSEDLLKSYFDLYTQAEAALKIEAEVSDDRDEYQVA